MNTSEQGESMSQEATLTQEQLEAQQAQMLRGLLEDKVSRAKCLRALREYKEFQELFDDWLFGSELKENQEKLLESMEFRNEDNEKAFRGTTEFIWKLRSMLTAIEDDGIQAARYLETIKGE